MREIKFRVWDKETKKFICDYTKAVPCHYEGEKYDIKIGGGRNHMGVYVLNKNNNDCELLLYTGLHDKNGKEIYEGDILKIILKIYVETPEVIGDVFFDNGSFLIRPKQPTRLEIMRFQVPKEFEIIGNIYENPELLEDEVK